jgi:hypothetical protein
MNNETLKSFLTCGDETLFEYWKISRSQLEDSLYRSENSKGCKNHKFVDC